MESEPVITSLILSDNVIVEQGTGKISLIGCFHALTSAKFPAVFTGFFATIGVTNLSLTGAKLALTLRIEIEETGHVLASTGGMIDIAIQPQPAGMPALPSAVSNALSAQFRKSAIDIPLRFGPVTFAQPGAYAVVALANNEQVLKRHLVIQPTPPKTQSKPPTVSP